MKRTLLTEFNKPSNLYRGKPFWAWNGDLEESELRRQVRIFKEMGMGGFFMHSRTGLETEYLSDKWFRLVEACCDEAKKLGLEAWLYDEDRWPSGAAGGIVTKNKEFRQKFLQLDVMDAADFAWFEKTLCAFVGRVEGSSVYDLRRLNDDELPSPTDFEYKVLAFRCVTAEKSSNYNGQTYLDTLNHEAVRAFIESTHKVYQQKFGDLFGNVIPGMFTDEPNHGSILSEQIFAGGDSVCGSSYRLPWTSLFLQTFDERYGYDLLDYLPAVFFDVDGQKVHKVRHDYHDCKTFLFCSAFARQIGQWCEKHGLIFTGHILWETPLSKQMEFVGSAMRFYEHMQAPGVDILTDCHMLTGNRPEYDTVKQCSSVQNQTQKKWLLSELYGCTGWDFGFKGHKAVGNWQAALGVNLRCHHLAWYTMRGEAKRDFPASIFYQSPWWKHYDKVEQYFARIGVVMTQGQPVRDVLVVNSVESMWQLAKVDWHAGDEYKDLDVKSETLRNWLLENHVDFDYGDEEMLSRLASVNKRSDHVSLTVGMAEYKTLIIPPLLTIRSSTLALARRFAKAGGKVIVLDSVPHYVDAVEVSQDPQDQLAFKIIPFEQKPLIEAVKKDRQIRICDSEGNEEPGVLYQLREDESSRYLFICNTENEKSKDITISLGWNEESCFVEDWDPEKGDVYSVCADYKSGRVTFNTVLAPAGSRIFVFSQQPSSSCSARPAYEKIDSQPLAGSWDYTLSEPNVMVLDTARYRISDGQWNKPLEILKIDRAVRDHLGISYRQGHMVQPWAQKDNHNGSESVPVELEFEFVISHMPETKIQLAIEQPQIYKISLNEIPVSSDQDEGWWVDKSIRLVDIYRNLLKQGTNRLKLSMDYAPSDGLEMIFLLGNFGVEVDGTVSRMTELPQKLQAGDWTKQGLPFYSGSVKYRKNIDVRRANGEKVFVELADFAGTCAQIYMDDKPLDILAWPPYEADVTDALGSANAELAIEVVSHRRNSFGPLHLASKDKSSCWNGPQEFLTEGKLWQDDYNLVPCGLLSEPRLNLKKRLQG